MNWRGIIGIYAGFAVVLGGAWMWLSLGSAWGLAVIGLGFVLAAASGVWIMIARRGPRPAKEKPIKIDKASARKAAAVLDDEADSIAKARLAAIAGRTGRSIVAGHIETEHVVAPVETVPACNFPELAEHSAFDELIDAAPARGVDVLSRGRDEAQIPQRDSNIADEPVRNPVTEDAPVDVEPVLAIADDAMVAECDAEPVALDDLPGFPWTARFIGLWAREVRYACPDDLRGAVTHWQRWADEQSPGTPLVEEAAEEFKAMLAAWRECGAEVPGLSSDDAAAVELAEEAEYDEALAELLPPMLRAKSTTEV